MVIHRERASTLAPDSDSVRITTEGLNILCSPLQSKPLISQPKIGRVLICELLAAQESKA